MDGKHLLWSLPGITFLVLILLFGKRISEAEAEHDRLRDRLRIPDAPLIGGNYRAYLDRNGRPWCWPTEYTIEWWNMTGSFENARQFRDALAGVPEPSRRLNRTLNRQP